MSEEDKDIDFHKVAIKIKPHLKALSRLYSIPFEEIIKVIEQDRGLAVENYARFKEMLEDGDDTTATKEGMNKALDLVIHSSDKLNELVKSASKLMGDTVKAMAIKDSKKPQFDPSNSKFTQGLRSEALGQEPEDIDFEEKGDEENEDEE